MYVKKTKNVCIQTVPEMLCIMYYIVTVLSIVHLFPDDKLVRNYKTKEKHVTDFVKNEFPTYDWVIMQLLE